MLGAGGGPLVGLFMLGIFFPRANKYGALVAVTVAVSFFAFCSIGYNLNNPYSNYALPTNFTCRRNETLFTNYINPNASLGTTFTALTYDTDPHYGKPGLFFAFKLSTFSYAPLSIAVVVVVGYLLSVVVPQNMTPYQQKLAYSLTYIGRNSFPDDERTATKDHENLMHEKDDVHMASIG